MAAPTIFVSSTFYDLRYAREALKRFIEQFGYLPILSENGAVFYDPSKTAAESCLSEVSNATMLVLLIGGRYGMEMPDKEGLSVTNAEYQQAVLDKIPVFALIDQATSNDYTVYQANKESPDLLQRMMFPNADSIKIFEFIDEVRSQATNNALVPFRNIADIEEYLRAQWAGMLHEKILASTRGAQLIDTMAELRQLNERVEIIASQILNRVGNNLDRTYITLLETLMHSTSVKDLTYLGAIVRPGDVLAHDSATACAEALGKTLFEEDYPDDEEWVNRISTTGAASHQRMQGIAQDYARLRGELRNVISSAGITAEEISTYEQDLTPRTPDAE